MLTKHENTSGAISFRKALKPLEKSDVSDSLKQLQITPEVAAMVVKEYLLPMFETQVKKRSPIKSKLGASRDLNASSIEKVDEERATKDYSAMMKESKTVLSEIKLTSVLLGDIEKLKADLDARTETIQSLEEENKRLIKKL